MSTDKVVQIYKASIALKDSMKMVQNGTTADHSKYSAYKNFAEKYNEIASAAIEQVPELRFLSLCITDELGNFMDTLWPFQKQVFDTTLANLLILISNLEGKLEIRKNDIDNLKNFIKASLRKAIFETPKDEKYIQNALEGILVGRGLKKGIDYDRESGRVKTSSKEVIPDFIFYKQNLACEVKYIREKSRIGPIVDEINADITAYSQKYPYIMFVIYDLGCVRDEDEFVSSFIKKDSISCILIKN